MTPKKGNIDRIISRTLAGDASNREEKELKDWILEEDEHYLEFKIIQESALKGFKERKLLNTDSTFEKVWETEESVKKGSHFKIGFSVFKTVAVSAAGLALILLSVFSYRQLVINQEISQILNITEVASRTQLSRGRAMLKDRLIRTQNGTRP